MKTAIKTEAFLPIYYPDGQPSYYIIEGLYDMELPNCLAVIRDIETDITHEVRLKTKWIKNNYDTGSVGSGIILLQTTIEMIDINFFERF